MDGLRDLDDDIPNSGVGVSDRIANPKNPEGRFTMPLSNSATHEFSKRFNEAMNPVKNGRFDLIPELILEHFSKFATFPGYPILEMIATHPTVSNACSIPAADAIAPGYKIKFLDSEDVDGNGIPDEVEAEQFGGVKRTLARIASMEALKNAIVALSKPQDGVDMGGASEADLGALALALERLAAYEAWERDFGEGQDAATAVNEGFVKPISDSFIAFSSDRSEDKRKNCLSALSLALSDLSKREHPSLDEVRSNIRRRGTIEALTVAKVEILKPEDEWDSVRSLNNLAVAVERLAAYENYSDRNAEYLADLTMALTGLSGRVTAGDEGQGGIVLGACPYGDGRG